VAQLFANNISTVLSNPCGTSDTTIYVLSATGLPIPGANDWYYLTLATPTTPETAWEVVKVTSVSGATLTVVRGQDSTSPLAWSAGARVELRPCGQSMRDMMAAGLTLALATPPAIGATTPAAMDGSIITAHTQFSGPGTGLTGTAASLTAGGCAWSGVTGKPTTVAGYGITDAITSANIGIQTVATAGTANAVAWANVSGKPTNVSAFTNDASYITMGAVTWTNLSGKPTALSSFTNDAGFITSSGSCANASTAGNVNTSTNSSNTAYSLFFGGIGTSAAVYGNAGLTFNPSTGNVSVAGDLTAGVSDRRLKTAIQPIQGALQKALAIRGVTYQLNDLAVSLGIKRNGEELGVIAQEVQAVAPQAVRPAPFDQDEDGSSTSGEHFLTVRYERLVPLLFEALRELNGKVDRLTLELEAARGGAQ